MKTAQHYKHQLYSNYVTPTLILQHCTTLDFDDDYVDLGTGFNGTYSVEADKTKKPELELRLPKL
jgi:hypothetical protein